MKKIMIFALIIFCIFFVSFNCKKTSELQDDSSIEAIYKGVLKLLVTANSSSAVPIVTNKPEDITSLVVTIENLEVHRTSGENAGWISLAITEGTFDLIKLDETGWAEIISNTEIESGNYNQIRFAVDQAQVTTESGIYEAEVPSGVIKIDFPFVVLEDGSTEITIEIDPEASLVVAGGSKNPKYILKPVLKISNVEEEDEEEDGE